MLDLLWRGLPQAGAARAWLPLQCWMPQAEEQIEGSTGWLQFSSAISETTHLSPALNFFQLKPISTLCYQGLSCDPRAVSMGLSLMPLTAGFLSSFERSHAADRVKHVNPVLPSAAARNSEANQPSSSSRKISP